MEELPETAFENVSPGAQRVLIPQGEYPGKFLRWERAYTPWGYKLYVYWAVFLSTDEKMSVQLRRYYNLSQDTHGKLIFGDGHDFRKDWIRANRGRLPLPRTRLPMSKFREGMMLLSVETVTRDGRRLLHPSSYHSKIGFKVRPLEATDTLSSGSA